MLMTRYRFLLPVLIVAVLAANVSVSLAQVAPRLELAMVGNGQGPHYAPAGQATQFKIEIFNLGLGDVRLIRGEAYLDPNLSGIWQLVFSEDMENFHLNDFRSAVWTFDLAMPPSIRAPNATNGVPQVVLLIRTIYSTANGLQQTEEGQFALSVPGAIVQQADYTTQLVVVGAVVVLVLGVLAYRRRSKRKLTR